MIADAAPPPPVRILTLGDSYTLGESVRADERWPMQLAAMMRARGIVVLEPAIVARTGWTTEDLAAGIDEAKLKGPFDIVTLLIGVNNQYRGRSVDEYRTQFRSLLSRAIAFAAARSSHVIVLSIPDWGVTPFAAGQDTARIAHEIDAFNAVNREEARMAGAGYVDVTSISRRARNEPSLVAGDRLHPSGAMYAAWAKLTLPRVLAAL